MPSSAGNYVTLKAARCCLPIEKAKAGFAGEDEEKSF